MSQWSTQEKTFIITGGASGLGAEYVQTFLSLGAKSIAILDVAEAVGKATAERFNKVYPGKVTFIKCDVGNKDDIARAFEQVVNKFKQIDVIINNAGIMVDAPEMWWTACNVNWQGVVSFTMKGLKHMTKEEGGAGGTIINISSTAGLSKFPFLPIYSGSKMAVLHFSQSLALEPFYENTGVRILTMCFGPTDTPLVQGLEKRCYDPKIGNMFVDFVPENSITFQKVSSAVASFIEMFKKGSPGSIWLSADDRPVKNITSVIDSAFQSFNNEIAGISN